MSEAGPVSPSRKFSDGGMTLLALVVALVLGVVISWTGHAGARRASLAVQPIGALWINAIRMTVIPLVVSLLVTGISSMSGVGGLGRVGVRSLVVFVVLLAGSALASLLVAVPLFGLFPDALVGQASLPIGAAAAAAELTRATPSGVVAFVLSMVPSNPVAAAAEGNMVALIVFTAVLAVAVSRGSAEARAPLEGFFRSLADAMTRLVGWIVSLAPVAVFCLALPLTVQSGGSLVGAVGFYVVAMAITCAVVTALCYPVAASGIRAFGRAMLPTQLIAASCSSSIASLPAMVRSADALAVPTRISGFVLPLAVSVFKPAAPVAWIVGALFIGKFYGVELGARELGVVALASVFVSFAAPGVPRGAFLLLTPLFEAIGLPAEGIGVLIAVDLIPDMCATVVQVTGDVTATTVIARLEQRD